MKDIIQAVCAGCSCNEKSAIEYIEDEVRHLKELKELDDLRYQDFEVACENLGIDNDYVELFKQAAMKTTIIATITAQPVYLKNYRIGGSVRLQNVLLEPGIKYKVTVEKLQNT